MKTVEFFSAHPVFSLDEAARTLAAPGGIGVFVDAIDEPAAGYYRRFGFVASANDAVE